MDNTVKLIEKELENLEQLPVEGDIKRKPIMAESFKKTFNVEVMVASSTTKQEPPANIVLLQLLFRRKIKDSNVEGFQFVFGIKYEYENKSIAPNPVDNISFAVTSKAYKTDEVIINIFTLNEYCYEEHFKVLSLTPLSLLSHNITT